MEIQISVKMIDTVSRKQTNAGMVNGTDVCANLGKALLFGCHRVQ